MLKDIAEKPIRLVHFVPETKWGCNKLETRLSGASWGEPWESGSSLAIM